MEEGVITQQASVEFLDLSLTYLNVTAFDAVCKTWNMRIQMTDVAQLVASSSARVQAARFIAEKLRHDDALHRLAMQAVFVLEDCHETLLGLSIRPPQDA